MAGTIVDRGAGHFVEWTRIGTLTLGSSGPIRRCGFGTAWLTGPGTFGPPPDREAAISVLRRAADAGVQLFDTADCYGPAVIEELVAEALHPYSDDIVVSTKGGRFALGDNRWRADGRPEHLKAACEASLRRLRADSIALYQLNAVDPDVPLPESLGALVELRDAGKIREIGVCNVDEDELEVARTCAPIVSVQDRFDVLTREREAVLDACARNGIVFLPWFPPSTAENAPAGSALQRISTRRDVPASQVALAWLLARSPWVLPLPGSAEQKRYELDLAALDLELTDDEVAELTVG